jgi:hypothetical protein
MSPTFFLCHYRYALEDLPVKLKAVELEECPVDRRGQHLENYERLNIKCQSHTSFSYFKLVCCSYRHLLSTR